MIQLSYTLDILNIGFSLFGGLTLLLRSGRIRAKRILSIALFLYAVIVLINIFSDMYVFTSIEILNLNKLILGAFLSSTFFQYVCELLRPNSINIRSVFIISSPILVLIAMFIFYNLMDGDSYHFYSFHSIIENINFDLFLRILFLILIIIYAIIYIVLLINRSHDYKFFVVQNVSDPESYEIYYLKQNTILLLVFNVSFVSILFGISPFWNVVFKTLLLVNTYIIFYKALFSKMIEVLLKVNNKISISESVLNESESVLDEQSELLYKQYTVEIKNWFEKDKPYLRDDLRLMDLQPLFPISRSYLSKIFNQEFGFSFSDFVNSYRVEESKKLLLNEGLSMPEIAERSGFNSVSTFRRAFIKHTGLKPSQYKTISKTKGL